MSNNLAAWTPSENCPPFVSINRMEDGKIQIVMRSRPSTTEVYGSSAYVTLTPEEFESIFETALENFHRG